MTRIASLRALWIALATSAVVVPTVAQANDEHQHADDPSAVAFAPAYADLPYAPPPEGAATNSRVLDFYAAPGAVDAPLVVFVHGGGWWRGDKLGGQRAHPEAMAEWGYAYASINYRLRGEATPDAAAEDVATAVAHLRADAERLGVDPDRIALMGHSAGAHLAALAVLDPRYFEAAGLPRDAVRAVVLLDGAGYDLATQISDGDNPELYRQVFGEDPVDLRRLSPLTYAATDDAPAFLIHHVADRAASARQAELLSDALRSRGGLALVFAAEGETHASINRAFGTPGHKVTEVTFRFLDKHLRGDE